MAKMREVDVYHDVDNETEAQALLAQAVGTPLAGHPELTCRGGAVEHDHPVAVSHYQLDDHGQPRKDPQGKPILNALRDDKGAFATDRQGRLQFPPPAPARLRVRLNYR